MHLDWDLLFCFLETVEKANPNCFHAQCHQALDHLRPGFAFWRPISNGHNGHILEDPVENK